MNQEAPSVRAGYFTDFKYINFDDYSHQEQAKKDYNRIIIDEVQKVPEVLKTTSGKEVDFILEHGREILAFEVKMTDNPLFSDAKNIIEFIENFPKTVRGIIVHSGSNIKRLHSKVIAVPWWML